MAMVSVLLLLLIGLAQSFKTLSPRAPPKLNIQRIIFPVEHNGQIWQYGFYGSIAVYDTDTSELFPTDEQVAGLAMQANDEAAADGVYDKELGKKAMTVLLVGNEAYFATPLVQYMKRGAPSFFYEVLPDNALLRRKLFECQKALADSVAGTKKVFREEHRTFGTCGEIVTMQMWHLKHPGEEWPGHAVTGAWLPIVDKTVTQCSGRADGPGFWGCEAFCKANGIRWIKGQIYRSSARLSDKTIQETLRPLTLLCQDEVQQEEPPDAGPAGAPTEPEDNASDYSGSIPEEIWEEVMEQS